MRLSSLIVLLAFACCTSALRCKMQVGLSARVVNSIFGVSGSSGQMLRSTANTVVCPGKVSCVTALHANIIMKGCTRLTLARLSKRFPPGTSIHLCGTDNCNAVSTPKTMEVEENETMEMPSEFLSIFNESEEQTDAIEEEKTEETAVETQEEPAENPLLEDVVPICTVACFKRKRGINLCCKSAGYKRGVCKGFRAICSH